MIRFFVAFMLGAAVAFGYEDTLWIRIAEGTSQIQNIFSPDVEEFLVAEPKPPNSYQLAPIPNGPKDDAATPPASAPRAEVELEPGTQPAKMDWRVTLGWDIKRLLDRQGGQSERSE